MLKARAAGRFLVSEGSVPEALTFGAAAVVSGPLRRLQKASRLARCAAIYCSKFCRELRVPALRVGICMPWSLH